MKHLYLMLVATVFAFTAQAAPKIKQIDNNKKRVAVTATSKTAVGTAWVATDRNGSQCTMTVVDKVAGVAILNARSCSNLSALKVGQKIEKSLFSDNSSTSGQTTGGVQNWSNVRQQLEGLSLIGFYSMADNADAKINSQSLEFSGETAFGFGAEYEYSFGDQLVQGLPMAIVGGVTYEMSREFTKVKSQGQSAQLSTKPSFSLWTPYVNGQVNVTERVSGFAGLNYSIPFVKNFGDDKGKSQLGYQIGASAKLTSSLAVDGIYRWVNLKTDSIDQIDLDGFVFRGRYLF